MALSKKFTRKRYLVLVHNCTVINIRHLVQTEWRGAACDYGSEDWVFESLRAAGTTL
jgi:hypothetical protein